MIQKTQHDFEIFLKQKLDLPRAVLYQIKDTHLCNEMIDEALSDIEEIFNTLEEKK